jgi:hypothetical protein
MADPDRISFLGAQCPANVRLRTVTLGPSATLDCDRADWADTLVIVERGELEIECRSGARARFAEGAILVFTGLRLRRLRNSGSETLMISALSRAER